MAFSRRCARADERRALYCAGARRKISILKRRDYLILLAAAARIVAISGLKCHDGDKVIRPPIID